MGKKIYANTLCQITPWKHAIPKIITPLAPQAPALSYGYIYIYIGGKNIKN
jgi:hypothetical protein